MKNLTAALCLLSVGLLSGCVDGREYRGRDDATGARERSCGNGMDDISHPYAGRCDWRRENGRDWANSGGNDVYPRGR
jgi:hypothetical protein